MRLGTRGSALALAQATWVAEKLRVTGREVEIVPIVTDGDRGAGAGDKERWVSALERALLAGEIDLAVHSAKDVPGELPDGLALVAFPPREEPRDALCGAASLAELPGGARVGTSSLRRAAQVRAAREDLEVVPLRGNVDTRLRKLADGGERLDAIVLAAAGLVRLGRAAEAGGLLDLVPAPGQGALAVEARPGALDAEAIAVLEDAETARCVAAERELVSALGASCETPVGAHAELTDGGELVLRGWAGLPDGSQWIADQLAVAAGEDPAALGREVAGRMLAVGAGELLERAAQR